jgi:glycosyltransferase involved in cell wall biosynthesis
LRIAINARFLLPGRLEGIGWYTHELVRRLMLAHPEDEFLLLFDRSYDPAFVYAANAEPVALFPPARHPWLWYWWFEHSVPRALRRWQPDVFFSPDSFCSLTARVPTVMTVHDLVPLHHPEQVPASARRYLQRWLPRFIERAEHITTVSQYVAVDLIETARLAPSKVSVIYNACRPAFRPLATDEQLAVRREFAGGAEYFFYTGAIHPRKNIPRLLRAFDAFKSRTGADAKLLLAGRFAWQTGDVTTTYEALRHRDDVRLLGYVAEETLPRLMASALALTYLSTSEGFGLPLIEAMHCDTPVVTANATALPEVAGDAALLVDPYVEDEIAAALERVYTDRALAADLVRRGRIQRERFSWDRAADELYACLRQVAARS